MRNAGLVAMAILVAACGSASGTTTRTPDPTPAAVSSPSPFASPSSPVSPSHSPSPKPFVPPSPVAPDKSTPKPVAFACSTRIPAGATLELVTLRGSTDIVVRDITNLSKPVTRCTFKSCEQFCASYGPTSMRFVTPGQISYIVRSTDGVGGMYLADLSTGKTMLIRKWSSSETYFWVYAWSPDGNSFTYFTSTQWRIRTAAGDQALSPLGTGLGYNYFSRRDVDNDGVGFSADGLYVASNQSNTTGPLFQVVRLADMKVVYTTGNGTMAVWAGSGAHLYFRVAAGLEEWDPVYGARLVVPGLGWTNPVPSADGKRIAYLQTNPNGQHIPRVLQLTVQPPQPTTLSSLFRGGVTFLKPTLVWYAEETRCGSTPCRCDDAMCEPNLTDRTYVHDLVTGVISSSIIRSVADTWPHVA